MILALSILVTGLVPFVFIEASHWWWLHTLPAHNSIGWTDAMIMGAVRALMLAVTIIIGGTGFVWAYSLLPKQTDAVRAGATLVLKMGLILFALPWVLAMTFQILG